MCWVVGMAPGRSQPERACFTVGKLRVAEYASGPGAAAVLCTPAGAGIGTLAHLYMCAVCLPLPHAPCSLQPHPHRRVAGGVPVRSDCGVFGYAKRAGRRCAWRALPHERAPPSLPPSLCPPLLLPSHPAAVVDRLGEFEEVLQGCRAGGTATVDAVALAASTDEPELAAAGVAEHGARISIIDMPGASGEYAQGQGRLFRKRLGSSLGGVMINGLFQGQVGGGLKVQGERCCSDPTVPPCPCPSPPHFAQAARCWTFRA